MVNTINWWLVSLLRYSGGMVKWTKIELLNLDRKTRKVLTIHNANVCGLYLSRKKGGRGLISMEICVKPLKQNVWKIPGECRTHSMWLVVGALGVIPKNLQGHLKGIGIPNRV